MTDSYLNRSTANQRLSGISAPSTKLMMPRGQKFEQLRKYFDRFQRKLMM